MSHLRNPGDFVQEEKKAYRADLSPPDDDWPIDVRMLVGYLHERLFEVELTVAEAKRECGMYDHNICGRFLHYVGSTIEGYLLKHRFALAKRLLHREELKVTQIALAVGYKSPSGFSTMFKRREDCSPTNFRELLQDEREENVEEKREA